MVTWDEAKRRTNLAKHGIDLADAAVFDLDTALTWEDRDVRHEQRFQSIGWCRGRLLFLVYSPRDDDVIHAISLRPTMPKERRKYAEES